MRFVLTAAALLVAVPLFAQSPSKADLDARAALQLQMARGAKPTAKAATKVPCPCTGGECKCADGVCPNCPTSPDAAARAALVAAMRPERVAAPRLIETLTLEEAVTVAKQTHRPVLISVAMDCSSLCSKLRPEIPTCHTPTLYGDGSPRLILVAVDQAGVWYRSPPWTKLPPEELVRATAADLKRVMELVPKATPPAPAKVVPLSYVPAFGVPCRT